MEDIARRYMEDPEFREAINEEDPDLVDAIMAWWDEDEDEEFYESREPE